MDDPTLVSIARIVRGAAELEHCLTLFIGQMVDTTEARAVILLGKVGWAERINIAKLIAKTRDDLSEAAHSAVFSEPLQRIIDVRNVLAHGAYLGRTEMGNYAFMQVRATETGLGAPVWEITSDQLKLWADILEEIIPKAEEMLQLRELRDRHREGLRPHPKAVKQPRASSLKSADPAS
jgi:hypothetical protein